jgi:pimeloyl-ACP methyl ester carboxylesterase
VDNAAEETLEPVSVMSGSALSERAVIAFGGVVGRFGGIGFGEFARSLAPGGVAANRRPSAFVRELPARWYNTVEPAALAPFVASQSDRTIVTLGNSMGGFGAILFAALLPQVRRSIAFCPQFSVHPAHSPWEPRWRDRVAGIDHWRYEACFPPAGAANPSPLLDHVLFCGAAEPGDVRHARAILDAADRPAAAFVIHDCGHDVAAVLKARGLLVPLLDRLIDDLATPAAIAAWLGSQNIPFDHLSNHPA